MYLEVGISAIFLCVTLGADITKCNFDRFEDLQLPQCGTTKLTVVSSIQCAQLCSQDKLCVGYTFLEYVCVLCNKGDNIKNVTFNAGTGVLLKRPYKTVSKDCYNCTYPILAVQDLYVPGHLVYFRGSIYSVTGLTISFKMNNANYNYQLALTTNAIAKNMLSSVVCLETVYSNPVVVGQTFELHILFQSTRVLTYINRVYHHTYQYCSSQTLADILQVQLSGSFNIQEMFTL